MPAPDGATAASTCWPYGARGKPKATPTCAGRLTGSGQRSAHKSAGPSAAPWYKELPRGAEADPADGAPFVARAAYVFNAAQVDAPTPTADAPAPGAALDPLPAFDAFVTGTGATIRHGGTRACYVPTTDMIHLPPSAAFHTPTGYAGTLAHELVHWTGAPHRLARDLTGRFGARAYAAEELVAELGAAFVLADLGIARAPHPDHAAYCASWAPLLRADPRALSHAATQASRAADYLAALQNPGGVDAATMCGETTAAASVSSTTRGRAA